VKRLRDRLRAARYGPRGTGDVAELAAEIEQVLRVLGADAPSGAHRVRPVLASALVALLIVPFGLAGDASQSPGAEALYEAGALRAAADSFASRAAAEPRDPAHWYNLGATLYRAGADGKAAAAWTRAARLAPRDAVIRRARRLLPAPDPVSERLLRTGWATPAEWALIAGGAWLVLWLAVLTGVRRRRVLAAAFGAIVAGAAVFGAAEWRRRERPVAVVVGETVPIRAAPYGGASATATIPAGGAVLVGRSYGSWREIRRSDGVRGWVLNAEIVAL
jgi:Bacterial SH3 domain